MAAATKTTKQKTAAKGTALPEGWKPMKKFKRCAFYADGTVRNRATGTVLTLSGAGNTVYQLTSDTGARMGVKPERVKALFTEAETVKPVKPAPKKTVKMKDGVEQPAARAGAKLDYDKAMLIRGRLANGEKRGALAREYKVDPWTIQAIAINYTYKIKEGDVNPIPEELMKVFLAGAKPVTPKRK